MDNGYYRKQPCNDCPYRLDAPLRKWSIEEFKRLLESEKQYLGVVWGCHKKDGHVCVGWLMNQDRRRFPSIMLRISLSRHNVDRTYLDGLHCKAGIFTSVEKMCKWNYPELLIKKKTK